MMRHRIRRIADILFLPLYILMIVLIPLMAVSPIFVYCLGIAAILFIAVVLVL